MCEILFDTSKLADQQKQMGFMWVPACSGIPGNEGVDESVKEAVRRENERASAVLGTSYFLISIHPAVISVKKSRQWSMF